MNEANPTATAQGSLSKTPFSHLVLYLYQHRSSGTLIVREHEGRDAFENKVLFHRGRAVAAHLEQSANTLDQGLLPLCAAGLGSFEFYERDLVGSGPSIVTGMFDPFAFVAEASRRYLPTEAAQEVLSKFVDMPLMLQPGMDIARLALTPTEQALAEQLSETPCTFETATARSGVDAATARRVLYVLLITKAIGPPVNEAPRSGPVPRAQTPRAQTPDPRAETPSPRARTPDPRAETPAPRAETPAPRAQTPAPRAQTPSPRAQTPSPRAETPSPRAQTPAPASRPVSSPVDRSRSSGAAWKAIASRAAEMASMRPPGVASPSRPLTPPPSERQSTPDAAARPPSRPLPVRQSSGPVAKSGSQPLQRPPSRPLTPSTSINTEGTNRRTNDQSRPLTPGPFGSITPNSQPRVTPSSPMSRVTPRPSPVPVEALDADGKCRRIEQLCQRHAYDDALPIVRGLVEEDRKNAKYYGLLSHVLLGKSTDAIGKEIVETVNQALRMNPDEPNALYTKARCYKRMGKEREALHYFRRTVSVVPNHIDATREIRLILLRLSEKKGKR